MDAASRLGIYGTLAPGKPNHHQLSGLKGTWTRGTLRGRLVQSGWGAALGYPALILDEDGPPMDIDVFESLDLPAHWDRLDKFEGEGYRRVIAAVKTDQGSLPAFVYVAADRNPSGGD